jgi:serine/threonine-protein kinase mTOR
LRVNKESLMAVLEAFVHDPLINWRLLAAGNHPSEQNDEEKQVDGGASLEEAINAATRTQRSKGYAVERFPLL